MDKLKSIIKQVMREESGTGGGASAGSFTPGEGPQTATRAGTDAAYKKNTNSKGTTKNSHFQIIGMTMCPM